MLQVGWNAFQDHMTHLFQERLATWPGQVIWKEYTPQHFGGPFGFQYGCVSSLGSCSSRSVLTEDAGAGTSPYLWFGHRKAAC